MNNYPEDKAVVQIRYANRHRRVKILFTEYTRSDNWVYFSEDLVTMLGFKREQHH